MREKAKKYRKRHHVKSDFAGMLRSARLAHDLKQIDVMKQTGIAQSKISLYENDRELPCRRNLDKLMEFYRIVNKNDIISQWEKEQEYLLHFTAK